MAGLPAAAPDLFSPAMLPHLAFAFALLVARAGCACMLLPVLGEAEVPPTLRAGFTLALVLLLLPGLLPLMPQAPAPPLRAAAMIGAEVATGLFLGWLARLVILALPFAGQLAALATGLSSVIQPDPALGAQSAALGRLLGVAAPVLVLASGLHALPIAAVAGSYAVVAPGALLPAADSMQAILSALAAMFGLAVRLAAPFLLASLAWHAALSLLGRVVPHLPLAGIAGSAQVLGGLVLLGLLATALLAAWQDRAAALLAALPGL